MQTHIYLLHKSNERRVKESDGSFFKSWRVQGIKGGKPYPQRHLVDNYRMPPLKKS